jgi:hypothetical protein
MWDSGYSPAPIHQIRLKTTDKTEPTDKTKPPERPGRTTLSRRDRLLLAAAGAGLLGLLLVAAWLEPSPNGRGTHRQLGLPPCTFLTLFGRPCPTCGMTTAWACLMKGQWQNACRANAGGTLLGILAATAVPWLLGSAMRGAWLGGPLGDSTIAWIATAVLLVTLIDWAFRLLAR